MIQSIQIFSLEELKRALEGMSNLRSADEDGIVVEITYASIQFKEALNIFFNQILMDLTFDES